MVCLLQQAAVDRRRCVLMYIADRVLACLTGRYASKEEAKKKDNKRCEREPYGPMMKKAIRVDKESHTGL